MIQDFHFACSCCEPRSSSGTQRTLTTKAYESCYRIIKFLLLEINRMISRTRHMEGFVFCFLFPGIWPLKASCARAEAQTPFQVSLLKLPQHSLKKWWQINKFSEDKSEHQVLNLLISLLCPHMKNSNRLPRLATYFISFNNLQQL